MFRLFSFLSIPFLLFSCNNAKSSNEQKDVIINSDLSYNPTDTIVYTYKTFQENSPYFLNNDESIDTTYYKITYPQFLDDVLNDSIKKLILFDGENTVNEAAQSFIDAFDEYIGDVKIENVFAPWSREVNSQVLTNSPIIMTLLTDINEYAGGAHGQHHTFYANFDLNKKQIIRWNDILEKNKFNDLTKIVEKKFRTQHNLTDTASLDKDFFFDDGIFTLNNNFGLTKKSLIIYYNEYEIKPYSEGPTILEIPYEDLKEVLSVRGQNYIQSIL